MRSRPLNASYLALIVVTSAAAACSRQREDQAPLPADPRVILQANLSHGIGESPLDSPLLGDSLAAALLIRLRKCAAVENLEDFTDVPGQAATYVEQLRSAALVADRDQAVCTSFPILIGEDQATYARLTASVARQALDSLSGDLARLLQQVEDRGWADWLYHFMWSQLFDSQFAWTTMMERALVPPLGRIIVWSIYPDHPFRSGTNYYPDDELRDHWLMVTWRPNSSSTIAEVGTRWKTLYAAALEGKRFSPTELDTLVQLGLADRTGILQLPVLSHGDSLYQALEAVATRYVEFLERRMPVDSLMVVTAVERSYTFAMAYHDISWGVVGGLVGSGRVSVPAALNAQASARKRAMRGVAAIVPVDARFAGLIRGALQGR